MLKVLQSLTNDSILIVKNCSEINLNQMKDKKLFIFTNSRISSSVKKELQQQPRKLFILGDDQISNEEEKHFNNAEDFIFELADEFYRCYISEMKDDIDPSKLTNPIHKQLKEVYRKFSRNNQRSISTETTIIWLKFNNKDDQMITNTQKLFKNIVSSFLIIDDCQECYGHLCTDEFNHSVFLIIDDNYQEKCLATLQTLENIKKMYRYDSIKEKKNGVRLKLTYDLITHYNQLANQCQNNHYLDIAKDMFLKARNLCDLLIQF
jgi:hypothetical protein